MHTHGHAGAHSPHTYTDMSTHMYAHVHKLTIHMHTCMCTQVELRLPAALRGREVASVVVTHSGQVPWTGPETLCTGGMCTPIPTWGVLASQE